MRTKLLLLCLALLALGSSSCRKDRPGPPDDTPVVVGSDGVYITNEGNFGWGNATVSYHDRTNGTTVEDLYAPANGSALGDVCQSMTLFNDRGYLVVNNSGKVVVVDPQTFVATATITGFSSPRYLLPVSNGKAYVTDLFADAIAVVDLVTNTITGSIPVPGRTEELALAYGKAFVTAPEGDQVLVIDTATDQLIDSIPVSIGGSSIRQDANGRLWVLCGGSMGGGIAPALHRFDPATLAVEASFAFPASASPWRLTINDAHDVLYFLDGGVYRMAIHDSVLPTNAFIPADNRNFYGLGVDPDNGTIYVSDAVDYVQHGVVLRYSPGGTELGSFLAGIIPGGFCFP
ncbi:MAG: YncE family protein [Flavobacteriales bacterium]|nr:hypothetical protein [Flavobacteriales bacterium]MCC6575850.1 YncE family protein [Flavobacteriales bacterium]NUQ13843.1 YncE family protein [Flavobacteriales bacterium]